MNYFKDQLIDNIKNLILSVRYLTKTNFIDVNKVVDFIRNNIDNLIKEPNEKDNILALYNERYYAKYIDKLILSIIILLDYDEIQKLFIYIINWTIPYFSFWLYLRHLLIEYKSFDEISKQKINIDNFKEYLKNNNTFINSYLQFFLHKLLMIKLITKYDHKKESLYNTITNLSIEQLFTELNIDDFYKKLDKNENNEIIFISIFEKGPEILATDKSFVTQDCIISDPYKIINSLINNLIKENNEKCLIQAEILSQFILYRFELIELDNNIFDFYEKYIFSKCVFCGNISNESYICLLCGKKMCHIRNVCDEISNHQCMSRNCMFIDMKNTICYYFKDSMFIKGFYHLYTSDSGAAPHDLISNEYKLNKEKYDLALKNYLCFNFH